jgi:hypothetical protein
LRGSGSNFDCYLRDGIVVRSWDGFLLYARPRTSDLYAICCEEVYELENWFKPHAKGVVVDVGVYIGTYTVRAMHTAESCYSYRALTNKLQSSTNWYQVE